MIRYKKTLSVLLVFMIIISSLMVVSANDSETLKMNEDDTRPFKIIDISEPSFNIVDASVVLQNGQFVISDMQKVKENLTEREFSIVSNQIEGMNVLLQDVSEEEIEQGISKVNRNSLEYAYEDLSEQTLRSGGRTSLQMYWWGYRLNLSNHVTNTTAQLLAGGAAAATLVSFWTPLMSAPTAVVKAIAKSVAVVFGGSAAMFWRTNEGNGVYLRFTGLIPLTVFYTGMFAQ